MDLTDIQIRILGCLLEKASTTPDNYPLSTNALVSACNQSTNRDPVVSYDAAQVDAAMLELRAEGLARTVTGGRANKHKHVLDEAWGSSAAELAVLAVLFLRGAQTPGELRTRTERMHGFESVETVDATLASLASLPTPFVEQLERNPGQKERRWRHLLGTETTHPDLHAGHAEAGTPSGSGQPTASHRAGSESSGAGDLELSNTDLRAEVIRLRADVDRLYDLLGETPDRSG